MTEPVDGVPQAIVSLGPGAAERSGRSWNAATLARAVDALRRDGIVLLEGVVDAAALDVVKARMDRDSDELLAFCETVGGNPRDRGHLQQGPPPCAPYVFADYVANPLIAQVLAAVLGADAYCEFYNGNTNCPGSTYQELHLDAAHADPDARVAEPTSAIVVNVVPQDVDERNGAIELWPGTHRIVTPTPVANDTAEARRRVVPPLRGCLRKGDALLRDSRVWHRGVPNPSNDYRHMMAMVFVAGAKPRAKPIVFARDCERLLATAPLAFHARFTDEPIDYLLGPTKRILRALQGPDAAQVTRH